MNAQPRKRSANSEPLPTRTKMKKLTPSQVKTLRRLTSNIQRVYADDIRSASFRFNISFYENGGIQFTAYNNTPDLRWFETQRSLILNMGVRGGIHWATADNINLKLVNYR